MTAWEWVEAWEDAGRPPLAWDIETAGKGTDEEEAELAAGQEAGIIYRIGFAYRTEGETRALSFPWGAPFLPLVQALLQGAPVSVVWSRHFDVPRVRAHGLGTRGLEITDVLHDAQEAWHVLYPDLKKSLEFVAPILIPGQPYWKDQAYDHPAFYNATDAAVTIELFERLVGGLLPEAGLAEVYAKDVQGLNALLIALDQRGLPVDHTARVDVAHQLSTERQQVLAAMQALVPPNAKRTKIWKRRKPSWGEILPKTVEVQTVERIARATKTRPARAVIETHYREQLPFVPSNSQLKAYAKVKGYRLPTVTDRYTGQTRETADEAALRRLALKHEQDPLFPFVLRYRELDRWLSTYVGRPTPTGLTGGLHMSPDGVLHYQYTHHPSTLRLAAGVALTMPREGPVRSLFAAPPGHLFWGVDYAGIEALLVGYFARSERYQRLARLDIHSFYLAQILRLEGELSDQDLPSDTWSDDRLGAALAALKRRFSQRRTAIKPLVHGGNYLMGPFEAQTVILKDQGIVMPLKQIKRLQALYWELFPEIPAWHRRVTGLEWADEPGIPICEQEGAYQRTWLRTPFGNWHQYYEVLRWEKRDRWIPMYGPDTKRCIAFLPQSCGRFILTRAAQRLPAEVQATLRLLLHDELLGICRTEDLDHVLQVVQSTMETPIPELGGLVVKTAAKAGPSWGTMQEVSC